MALRNSRTSISKPKSQAPAENPPEAAGTTGPDPAVLAVATARRLWAETGEDVAVEVGLFRVEVRDGSLSMTGPA